MNWSCPRRGGGVNVVASTLLVISAAVDAEARTAVARGQWPHKDFLDLAERLDADVIDTRAIDRSRRWRLVRRVAGRPATQALMAFSRRRRYDAIVTDGEHIGIPLALLTRFSRRRPSHVTIGHLLSTPTKRWILRRFRLQAQFDRVLLHATRQYEAANCELGFRADQLTLVPYQVDPAFWSPREIRSDDPMICSAGLEYRDYPTLMNAVRGLPVRVVIAAGSRWSQHTNSAEGEPPPANVEITSLDYPALRDLYARARFVVVPLKDIDNQAGVTTILEAMAMAKAVIVTSTRGQCDVIRGRLCTALGVSPAPQGGPAPFQIPGPLAEAETGLYVLPGDSAGLRRAIDYLLAHPEV